MVISVASVQRSLRAFRCASKRLVGVRCRVMGSVMKQDVSRSARIVQYLQSELTAAVAVAGKKHTSNSSMLRLSTTLKLVSEAFPRCDGVLGHMQGLHLTHVCAGSRWISKIS